MRALVVDAHHHLWNIAEQSYPWLRDAPAGSPEALLAERDGCYEAPAYRSEVAPLGVVASVHVQAEFDPGDPIGETRWLQAQREAHGLPTAIVGTARLEDADVRDVLLAHLHCDAFRGIRQLLGWAEDPELRIASGPDVMRERAWRQGFALLEPLGLAFDLQVYPGQLADAAELAAAFPLTRIVLNHLGCPEEDGTGRAEWSEGMRRLAQCENVTVKLSGVTQPQRSVAHVRELVEEALATFGCERAMFGTNLPVERLDGSVDVLVEAIDAALAGRSRDEQAAVWGGTAARVYRLDATALAEAGPSTAAQEAGPAGGGVGSRA